MMCFCYEWQRCNGRICLPSRIPNIGAEEKTVNVSQPDTVSPPPPTASSYYVSAASWCGIELRPWVNCWKSDRWQIGIWRTAYAGLNKDARHLIVVVQLFETTAKWIQRLNPPRYHRRKGLRIDKTPLVKNRTNPVRNSLAFTQPNKSLFVDVCRSFD